MSHPFLYRCTTYHAGYTKLIHVDPDAVQARQSPTICVRVSEDGFQSVSKYSRVEILGPSDIVERFNDPLPPLPSGRRATVVVSTRATVMAMTPMEDVRLPDEGEVDWTAAIPCWRD